MRVAIEPPSAEEAHAILAEAFPGLGSLLPMAVTMLMLMRRAAGQADASEAGYSVRPLLTAGPQHTIKHTPAHAPHT